MGEQKKSRTLELSECFPEGHLSLLTGNPMLMRISTEFQGCGWEDRSDGVVKIGGSGRPSLELPHRVSFWEPPVLASFAVRHE